LKIDEEIKSVTSTQLYFYLIGAKSQGREGQIYTLMHLLTILPKPKVLRFALKGLVV
jgi:hypothetical protein